MTSPYAVTLRPSTRSLSHDELEALSDQRQLEVAKARLGFKPYRDPIGETFGGKYYVLNYTFPFLLIGGEPITVTRYYPDRGVAIDIFKTNHRDDRYLVKARREALSRGRVRYAVMYMDSSELSEILPQIGAQ